MMDCWHTQLRIVASHFPDMRLRPRNHLPTQGAAVAPVTAFVYVTPTVAHRSVVCPTHVIEEYRRLGYVIIHIQEPRE